MLNKCSPVIVSPNVRSFYGDPQILVHTVKHAAVAWEATVQPCADLSINVVPTSKRLAREDGVNLLVFRNETWCHNERCSADWTFPSAAKGMTTTYPVGSLGPDIREADIELNGVHYSWTTVGNDKNLYGDATRTAALEQVIVHELGHVLGLPDICGPEHGSRATTCRTNAHPSVMNANAHLWLPTEYDRSALCQVLSQRCSPPTEAALGAAEANQPSLKLSLLLILVSLFVGVFVWVRYSGDRAR